MGAFGIRCTAVALLGLACVGCTNRSSVTEQVRKQLRSGAAQVDMGQIGEFEWDNMFVFGPYQPRDGICKTLKLSFSQCYTAGVRDVDEGEFLLVFMHDNKASRVEYLPRSVGNFGEACLATEISKSKAQFTVERKPDLYLMCR
jgi:hypothetical protein